MFSQQVAESIAQAIDEVICLHVRQAPVSAGSISVPVLFYQVFRKRDKKDDHRFCRGEQVIGMEVIG